MTFRGEWNVKRGDRWPLDSELPYSKLTFTGTLLPDIVLRCSESTETFLTPRCSTHRQLYYLSTCPSIATEPMSFWKFGVTCLCLSGVRVRRAFLSSIPFIMLQREDIYFALLFSFCRAHHRVSSGYTLVTQDAEVSGSARRGIDHHTLRALSLSTGSVDCRWVSLLTLATESALNNTTYRELTGYLRFQRWRSKPYELASS